MPFKSQAQRRKFAQLLVEGKISPDTYEEWNRETGSATLPDHVKRKGTKKTAKAKTRARRARPARTARATKKSKKTKKTKTTTKRK